jgi:hypothetical protein
MIGSAMTELIPAAAAPSGRARKSIDLRVSIRAPRRT